MALVEGNSSAFVPHHPDSAKLFQANEFDEVPASCKGGGSARPRSESEQTIALASVLKDVSPSQAAFLQSILLERVRCNNPTYEHLSDRANSPDLVDSISNKSRSDVVQDLLSNVPLLRPANKPVCDKYAEIIKRICIQSLDDGEFSNEARQILAYALIHPVFSAVDRQLFTEISYKLECQSIIQNIGPVPLPLPKSLASNDFSAGACRSLDNLTSFNHVTGDDNNPGGLLAISAASSDSFAPQTGQLQLSSLSSTQSHSQTTTYSCFPDTAQVVSWPGSTSSINSGSNDISSSTSAVASVEATEPPRPASTQAQSQILPYSTVISAGSVNGRASLAGLTVAGAGTAPPDGLTLGGHVSRKLSPTLYSDIVNSAPRSGSSSRPGDHKPLTHARSDSTGPSLTNGGPPMHVLGGGRPLTRVHSSIRATNGWGSQPNLDTAVDRYEVRPPPPRRPSSATPPLVQPFIPAAFNPERNSFLEDKSGMRDVPIWLKTLRLHKYATLFQQMDYDEMMALDEDQLARQGVTKGARHKIILCIQKLKERPQQIADIRNDLMEHNFNYRMKIHELRQLISTPIKPTYTSRNDNDTENCFSEAALEDTENLPVQMAALLYYMGDTMLENFDGPDCPDDDVVYTYIGLIDKCLHHEAFVHVRGALARIKHVIQQAYQLPAKRRGGPGPPIANGHSFTNGGNFSRPPVLTSGDSRFVTNRNNPRHQLYRPSAVHYSVSNPGSRDGSPVLGMAAVAAAGGGGFSSSSHNINSSVPSDSNREYRGGDHNSVPMRGKPPVKMLNNNTQMGAHTPPLHINGASSPAGGTPSASASPIPGQNVNAAPFIAKPIAQRMKQQPNVGVSSGAAAPMVPNRPMGSDSGVVYRPGAGFAPIPHRQLQDVSGVRFNKHQVLGRTNSAPQQQQQQQQQQPQAQYNGGSGGHSSAPMGYTGRGGGDANIYRQYHPGSNGVGNNAGRQLIRPGYNGNSALNNHNGPSAFSQHQGQAQGQADNGRGVAQQQATEYLVNGSGPSVAVDGYRSTALSGYQPLTSGLNIGQNLMTGAGQSHQQQPRRNGLQLVNGGGEGGGDEAAGPGEAPPPPVVTPGSAQPREFYQNLDNLCKTMTDDFLINNGESSPSGLN